MKFLKKLVSAGDPALIIQSVSDCPDCFYLGYYYYDGNEFTTGDVPNINDGSDIPFCFLEKSELEDLKSMIEDILSE